nr:cell surface protein [uncultured Methanobacterium sp.]
MKLIKDYKKASLRSFIASLLVLILFFGVTPISAVQWEVGTGQNYNTIQSAIDNENTHDNDVINVHEGIYAEDVIVNKILTIQANLGDDVELNPSNTGFTVVNNETGDGSGSTVDGFKITNSPTGTGINVSAENCTVKNNQISGGTTGILALANNTLVKNNVISNVLNISIQVGNTLLLNESGTIKDLGFKPMNCVVENNQITGGSTGISVIGANARITGNDISNTQNQGIALLGCNPVISGNNIRDMVGGGSKIGISLAAINSPGSGVTGPNSLNISGNTLFNIKSTNDTAQGINAFAMSMSSSLDSMLILGNTVSQLWGMGTATAISMVCLALNGTLSSVEVVGNTINNVFSQGVNSTSTAISLIPMGFEFNAGKYNNTTTADTLTVSKNKISDIYSDDENGTINGISMIQLCTGNASISQNNLSNFHANRTAFGIVSNVLDYTTFQSRVTIDQNTISDFTANNQTSGIAASTLGNANIQHNNIFRLNSAQTKYLIVVSCLQGNNTITGNNLEGNGIGEGITVMGNNNTINYNRIVNFQHYIQNMNFTELYEFSQGQSLPTDEQIRDYLLSKNGTYVNGTLINITEDNITSIISGYHTLIDNLNNLTKSNTTAPYNWYGTNSDPGSDKFLKNNGTLEYSPWLVMNVNVDPSTIYTGQTSTITADVYRDSAGGDHRTNASMYFSGPQVTFTTNLGNVGSKSVVTQWASGAANAILRADEGEGIATVTAGDYQILRTLVTILAASNTSPTSVNAANTVGMQSTGIPINGLVLAILMVISGLILPKRR